MTLFWIGIIVFLIGFAIRWICKIKYTRDYKENARTELKATELRSKYRPMIFTALVVEIIGCVIAFISAFMS